MLLFFLSVGLGSKKTMRRRILDKMDSMRFHLLYLLVMAEKISFHSRTSKIANASLEDHG